MRFFCVSVFFLLIPAAGSVSRIIALEDLPRLVRSNSPDLAARAMALRIQRISLARPLWNILPDLSLNYTGGWTDPSPLPPGDGWRHGFDLSSSWSPLANATRFYEFRIQKEVLEQEAIRFGTGEAAEFYKALVLFWDTIRAGILHATALSNEAVSRTRWEYLEAQKALGRASELQVLTGRADYDNALYNTAAALTDWELTLKKFRIVTGTDDAEPDPYAWSRPEFTEELSHEATAPVPEILLKETEIRILRIRREDALRRRILPEFRVSAGMDWWEKNYAARTWTSDSLSPALSLNLSLPLFERNSVLDEVRTLDLRLKAARLERDGLVETRSAEIGAVLQEYGSRSRLVPVARRRVESAETALASLRESSRLGLTPLMDVLQAEKNLRDQERDLVVLRIELLKLRARLGYETGDPFRYMK